jgi:hypothetical protein
MSWMSEISIMIAEAAEHGVTLEVSDFHRDGDTLTIDGMDVDEWFALVIRDDRLEDREV